MSQNKSLVESMQQALQKQGVEAWLFYGFRDLDPIGCSILKFPSDLHATRRWFYLVPAAGEPRKLVHRIESATLDHLPGTKAIYLAWGKLKEELRKLLNGVSTVGMQYSENNSIPYVSRVDAGTIELIRSMGVEVVSSGDLIQHFEAVWTPEQVIQHCETARLINSFLRAAFEEAAKQISARGQTDELSIQRFLLDRFSEAGLTTDYPPIVAVNRNSGNPHYAPTPEHHSKVGRGDHLLIDLWAKPQDDPEAVYADTTWTGFFGKEPPAQISEVFEIVHRARCRGSDFLQQKLEGGIPVQGWEVDDVVRQVIEESGYASFILHRTGHNLGREVHGNGVNFDNLETHDTRQVIPGIVCTIEPGIYLDDFGIRNEINLLIKKDGVEITTPPQEELLTFDL